MAHIGNPITTVPYTIDRFSGTASATAFGPLVRPPAGSAAVAVFIAGLYQVPGVDYTVTGTTINFAAPPASGTNNIIVHHLGAGSIGVNYFIAPTSNSVTTNSLITGVVTTDKIANTSITTDKIANTAITDAKLANTAVTAGVYGNTSIVPVITVNDQGRVTNVVNVVVSTANTQILGLINAGQISNIANTQITGLITASQIANVANLRVYSLGVGTDASQTLGEIRSLGNITAYYSDRRLKKNITPILNAIEKIKSISGVYYEPNDVSKELGYNNDEVQVGVIAQELEQVLPEVVALAPIDSKLDENGKLVSISGNNYKTVQYDKIIPLLIEGIKEQQIQIEKLTEEINRLK